MYLTKYGEKTTVNLRLPLAFLPKSEKRLGPSELIFDWGGAGARQVLKKEGKKKDSEYSRKRIWRGG